MVTALVTAETMMTERATVSIHRCDRPEKGGRKGYSASLLQTSGASLTNLQVFCNRKSGVSLFL